MRVTHDITGWPFRYSLSQGRGRKARTRCGTFLYNLRLLSHSRHITLNLDSRCGFQFSFRVHSHWSVAVSNDLSAHSSRLFKQLHCMSTSARVLRVDTCTCSKVRLLALLCTAPHVSHAQTTLHVHRRKAQATTPRARLPISPHRAPWPRRRLRLLCRP